MASSMAAMSTDDIGLAAEILRDDEMERRWVLDIDEWDERADATDEEGEIDRGVEMLSEEVLDVLLLAYDAIACVKLGMGGKKGKGSRTRKTRL